MKILQMCTRFPPAPGGVETDVYKIAKELTRKGHAVSVFASDLYTETPFRKVDEKNGTYTKYDGIPVRRFRAYTPGGEMHYVFEPGMVPGALTEDADIVHAHSYGYFQTHVAGLMKSLGRCKFVFSTHYHPDWSMWGGDKRKTLRRIYDRAFAKNIMKSADAIVVESASEAEMLRSLTGLELANTVTIPPGIDWEKFENPVRPTLFREKYEIDCRYVLFVGRLASNKGLDTLLEAVPIIAKEYTDVKIVIAGEDAGMRAHLEKKAEFLGVRDIVVFTGHIKDENVLLSAYSGCDVFVLPSEYEAFGIVLLEAMASGKPCIGTNVGGIPESVIHGKTGLLVEYGNRDILAERICQLLLDDTARKRLGETARNRVREHFTWEKVGEQFEILYNNVLENDGENDGDTFRNLSSI